MNGNIIITEGRGIQITFENGVTISVQFGKLNYCENRSLRENNKYKIINGEYYFPAAESTNAEIAIWDKKDKWLTKEFRKKYFNVELDDDVEGWVSPDEIGNIIGEICILTQDEINKLIEMKNDNKDN